MVRPALADPDFAPARIVLRTPNPLGDAVMAEPAMRAIAARFPAARIDVAVPASLAPLAACWRFASGVVPLARARGIAKIGATLADSRALRAGRYDLAVVLPNSLGSALTLRAAGARRLVGYARDARRLLLSDPIEPPVEPRREHMLAYYWRIAEALGCGRLPGADVIAIEPTAAPRIFAAHERTRPMLDVGAEAATKGAALLARHDIGGQGFVVLAPGAAYGPAKQWPVVHYRALAGALARDHRIVVVGTRGEKPIAGEIAAACDGVDLAGATDLAGLIGVMARARGFVGNDSGAAHLAGALGLPGVVIYGSTSEAHSGQIGARLAILHRHLDCSPCFARTCPLGHLRCLTEISPESVREAFAAA